MSSYILVVCLVFIGEEIVKRFSWTVENKNIVQVTSDQ